MPSLRYSISSRFLHVSSPPRGSMFLDRDSHRRGGVSSRIGGGKEGERTKKIFRKFPRKVQGTKWTKGQEEARIRGREGEVSEALYGLGARGIRGLPLACARSLRRHVCFSVVKRAAGRQTGLNQPLPPPPPPPPSPLSLSLSRSYALFLSLPLSRSCLLAPLPRARLVHTPPSGPRVSPLGNKLLFV